MSFDSLGLAPALLRALADYGYTQATPIQAAAIPPALEGHHRQDCRVRAAAVAETVDQRPDHDAPPARADTYPDP
jgi:hypothetical protein